MAKLILTNDEYALLQRVLQAVPPAQLPRLIPDCTGADLRFYRNLLTKVLHKNHSFPDTDDGMIDPSTGIKLTPSYHGKDCLGNGEHPDFECCCEECDYFEGCFPEYDQ